MERTEGSRKGEPNGKKAAAVLVAAVAIALGAYSGTAPAGPRFALELAPGPQYRSSTRWLIFALPIYPQVACWVEDLDGRYIGTIYVTAKGASSGWISAPKEGRPEALPVWSRAKAGRTDAVSAATSANGVLRGSDLAASLPVGRYAIMLETNRSYDYNEAYPRESAGVSGQPSIVYRAELLVGTAESEAAFAPIGTGSPDGADGRIREGLDGITTALELFSRMVIRYRF
ncbi:MAG: DUF2271 domain-containing protein [Spirochaetaceae bacterium]|nr:DUF2271 domain-containing protein [Spirochaetaceae bacterium]